MKELLVLFLKSFFINTLLLGVLYGTYNFFLGLIDYSAVRMLNILLVNTAVEIILSGVAFILTIKILSKNNKEVLQNNIGKLIIFLILTQLLISIALISGYVSLYYPKKYFTPIITYILILHFLNYLYLNIVYSIFVLKKYRKTFAALILVALSAYAISFSIYRINFNKDYKKAEIKNEYILSPTKNIEGVVNKKTSQNGNSAKEFVTYLKDLKKREQIENNTKNSLCYIRPNLKDFERISKINQKKYLSLSEEYLPDDIILANKEFTLSCGVLRALSRGNIKLAEEKIKNGEKIVAETRLKQMLLFADQLIRSRDDSLILKLTGIAIAKDNGKKLLELNSDNSELKKYLEELDKTKESIQNLTSLQYSAARGYFDTENAARYFKFRDKHNKVIGSDPIIKYSFYIMDMPLGYYSAQSMEFLDQEAPGVGETILQLAGGMIIKANVGKNYTFYNKALELYQSNKSKELEYYLNHDYLSIIKKHGDEISRISEIENELKASKQR